MRENGIEPPRGAEEEFKSRFQRLFLWLQRLRDAIPKVQTFEQSLDVSSVAANSESVQTFTVSGLKTSDVVTVNKPSNSAGLDLAQAWVSADDTLSIKFRNHTGSPIDPASETYRIVAIRI